MTSQPPERAEAAETGAIADGPAPAPPPADGPAPVTPPADAGGFAPPAEEGAFAPPAADSGWAAPPPPATSPAEPDVSAPGVSAPDSGTVPAGPPSIGVGSPMDGYYPPVSRVAASQLPSGGPPPPGTGVPTGQFPTGQFPPGGYPPAAGLPGAYPPGPPGAYPPVGGASGAYPPAPPGAYPPAVATAYPGGAPTGYAPTAAAPTNGWAIAALVCGLLSLITGITAILAVIFGFIALSQIKKSGEQGRGMAIAGLVIGFAVLVLSIIGIILAIAFFGWFISNVDVARLPVQVNLVAASAAQESYQDTNGRYATTMTELRTTGMVPTSGPVITIVYASETGFCMEGTQSGETYFVTQNQLPQVGSCLLQ